VAKIVLIEHDYGLLDAITGKLRKKAFIVEPICAESPKDFLMEIAETIYEHRQSPEKTIILISDYHLPGIKGTELIKYARDVASYLGFRAIGYGIMTSDHNVHLLPELVAFPIALKDSGLHNIIGFVESLVSQQRSC